MLITAQRAVAILANHGVRAQAIEGTLDVLIWTPYTKRMPSGHTYGSTMVERILGHDVKAYLGY